MVSLEEQRKAWASKPLLRKVYREFFEMVREKMIPGDSLELGSGIGEFPYAIHSDLNATYPETPGEVNAYLLPYRDKSFDNLILIDTFHHFNQWEWFFNEAWRVLKPNGRIIILDPYVSPMSLLFYMFHDEPVQQSYTVQRWLNRHDEEIRWVPNLREQVISIDRIVSFRYLLSGGYSHRSLYPMKMFPLLRTIDGWLSKFPRIFSCRVLIVLGLNTATM